MERLGIDFVCEKCTADADGMLTFITSTPKRDEVWLCQGHAAEALEQLAELDEDLRSQFEVRWQPFLSVLDAE